MDTTKALDFIINKVVPSVIGAAAAYAVPLIFNTLIHIMSLLMLVINSVFALLFRKAGYLFHARANMRVLTEIADKLNREKESVEAMSGEHVNEWMKKVQAMEELVGKINEDYNNMYAINCWRRYRVGKQAAEAALEMEKILSERQHLVVLTKRSTWAMRKMFDLPDDMLSSTASYLRTACDYLQDDQVEMVGIWGMGGVGKTTLLQRINNHLSVPAVGFDYVIWVVVSQEPNLDKLQKDIAQGVGLALEATLTVESQAQALYNYLKTKKFLLLLDDIWEPLDLATLGIPCPSDSTDVERKRKVVFTTCFEAVCDQMTAWHKFKVRCKMIRIECLQPEEAWKLFLDSVGEGMRSVINSDKRVRSRAIKIAKKCGGLPLALVVTAKAMSANKTWREWEDAINSINKIGVQEIWSKRIDLFPLLKVSYDRLPNETIRNCFLCCAMWPEDHTIWEYDLINCWLGMNIIDSHGNFHVGHLRGHSIIQILKGACLLQRAAEGIGFSARVEMHDIIRGMALWIIADSRKWVIRNHAKLKEEAEDATDWGEPEVISLMYGRSGELPQHIDCFKLRSMMLRRNSINRIPEGFFQNMNALTFLDLSENPISELPPAIGMLLQLRFLDLSSTSICSVPMELGNLAELKILTLCPLQSLRSIPRGMISRLQKIEHLVIYDTGFDGWDTEGQASIEELVCSRITSLGLDIWRFETLEQLSRNPNMSLWLIKMRHLEGLRVLPLRSLFQVGNTRCTLLTLYIQDCDSLEEISASSQKCEEEFDSLEELVLSNLPALERITFVGLVPGSLLQHIRYLAVWSCAKLKNVTWILHLPYLESLAICDCPEMALVIGIEEGSGNCGTNRQENLRVFHYLNNVLLGDLPQLCSFSTRPVAFPSLISCRSFLCPKFDQSSLFSSAKP